MSNENPPPPGQQRIAIEFPKDLNGIYANVAFITHTPTEIVLDFVQLLPHVPKGRVVSRVVMSPVRAKMLQIALAQNLANYEKQFGEIRLTQQPNLADQLFRFRQENDDEKDDEGPK
ncbi:MAG: DUF3467 domain-containing protein [Ardenticatenaceae bacterium]|jgi:hypothetical protein|nr:DUF3467 domain-containing protein [Anaerolineales bacterium]MCB8918260.1 DUF3467 domain-containing protein [Ardenticatenaceae bacterium]